jgi:hypothetical protein
MSFNREGMKSLLIRDKGFLRELFEGPNPLKNKRVLKGINRTKLKSTEISRAEEGGVKSFYVQLAGIEN